MAILRSDALPDPENRAAMLAAIEEFRQIETLVRDKELAAREKFHGRGQKLPRERLGLLLDAGAPFFELSSLAGYRMHDDHDGSGAGGGIIAGIGFVSGVRCAVNVSNSALKGGTISPAGLQKSLRLQRIAYENRLPVVSLIESGGANLNYQAEVFVEGARCFANQARLSAAGIPQVTVVHGSSTAGGAYMPGLSDHVVMVRGRARVFLAGPPLLKAATGEIASEEELGGADMHGHRAGTAEYLAEDDDDGIRIAREIVAHLNLPKLATSLPSGKPPRYAREELLDIAACDYRRPYDVREIIARLVDDSDFLDFKAPYDHQTVCGFAHLHGHGIGIIGNNGPITNAGANKAAQFIQLCEQNGQAIVYLQNTTGFMVGRDAEQHGIVKHGSKMLQAVANARVPQLTVLVGGAFGAGNYGMCGRGLDPRFILAWPNARIGVMGGEQAGRVMSIIAEQKHARLGEIPNPDVLAMIQQQVKARMDAESTALFATARLWDDGLIDPRDTRDALGFLLDTCAETERRQLHPNHFGVARF